MEQWYVYFYASLDRDNILPYLHLFFLCIYILFASEGVISKYLYLMIIRIYFITIWTGLWCIQCIYCRVYHLVPCELIAIQYPLFLAINRSMQSSSTPIVLLQPPYHHLYIQDDAHNILCISCVHFILTTNIVSNLPPYGQIMLDLQQDTFSYI